MATAGRAQAVREQRRAGLTEQTVPPGTAPPRLGSRREHPCARPGLGAPGRARRRDRRGRGMRGSGAAAGPAGPAGVPAARSPKAAFDAIVVAVVEELESRWTAELGLVEFAVEETPMVPDDWDADTVPLASLVRGTGGAPTRLVLFRRPIELRCRDPQRPVGDGAHRARRAGLRAARALRPRRSTRATTTTPTTETAQRRPGRDGRPHHLQRQRRSAAPRRARRRRS